MFKPFANSARALSAGPLTWKTWTGLILVPVIVLGALAWSLSAPTGNHNTATAAVVNNDQPVTVHGQLIPLGRQLAGNLTHGNSPYNWVLTDSADASAGLANGSYTAVVTIPQDFSARATSTATAAPEQASTATVTIQTSNNAGVVDPALSAAIAGTTQQTLNHQVVQTYLDNIYLSFGTIHEQLNKAADGADQLATGTGQVAGGAQQLASGAGQLAAAADKLAAGTAQLASGSATLSNGLSQAQRQTAQLPALTRQLAAGAQQVAQGNTQLANAVVPLANKIIAVIDGLPSASSAASQLQQLADQCAANGGGAQFCQHLTTIAQQVSSNASTIDGAVASIRAEVVQTRDDVQALANGAQQVATGNTELANQAASLTSGIASAANGARQLNTGIGQANSGAHQLASGADQLAGGAAQLDSGASQVNTGSHQLASQLGSGRNQVPDYTAAQRAHLASVAANPTTATIGNTPLSTLIITLCTVLAIWALALATYLLTRAIPDAVLTARDATWRIIIRAALPGTAAACLTAAAATAIAAPILHLGLAGTIGFLLIALLAAGTFVSLNQAVTALLGRTGRLASLAVLILTLGTGIVSTLPGPLYALSGWLPTHGAIIALRAAATGGAGLTSGIVELAAWLVIGTLASIVVTDRRRYLSTRQLRVQAHPATA